MVCPVQLSSSTESRPHRELPSSNRHSAGGCSKVPSTDRSSQPIYWYCCQCHFGPMNQQIYVQCIQCDHRGSSCCRRDATSKQNASVPEAQKSSFDMNTIMEHDGVNSQGSNFTSIAETTTLPPEHGPVTETGSQLEGEWLWSCHNCGDGPMTVSVNLACTNCGHQRCKACQVYTS